MQMRRGLEDGFIDNGQCQMIHVVDTAGEAVSLLNRLNAAGPMPTGNLNNKNVPAHPALLPPQRTTSIRSLTFG